MKKYLILAAGIPFMMATGSQAMADDSAAELMENAREFGHGRGGEIRQVVQDYMLENGDITQEELDALNEQGLANREAIKALRESGDEEALQQLKDELRATRELKRQEIATYIESNEDLAAQIEAARLERGANRQERGFDKAGADGEYKNGRGGRPHRGQGGPGRRGPRGG